MKCDVDPHSLRRAIDLQGVIYGRSPSPKLQCVLLQTTGEELEIQGMGTDCHALRLIPCKKHRPGAALIPCDKLAMVLRGIEAPIVTLEMDDKGEALTVVDATGRCKIYGFPAGEFARRDWAPREKPPEESLELPQAHLLAQLQAVKVAAGGTSPNVYIEWGDNKDGRVWATDGARAAIAPLPRRKCAKQSCAIPKDGVAALLSSLDPSGDLPAIVTSVEGGIRVACGDRRVLWVTGAEGTPPPIDAVLQNASAEALPHVWTVNGPELAKAIGQASIMCETGSLGAVAIGIDNNGKWCVVGIEEGAGEAVVTREKSDKAPETRVVVVLAVKIAKAMAADAMVLELRTNANSVSNVLVRWSDGVRWLAAQRSGVEDVERLTTRAREVLDANR